MGYEKAWNSLRKVVLRFPSTEAQKTLDKILRIEKERVCHNARL
jgi:hypothetical protein